MIVAGVAAPEATLAEDASEPRRVGLLSPGPPLADSSEQGSAFFRGMADHGYALGRNLAIERRGAKGQVGELPRLAADLAAAKVEAIVTVGYPTAVAAKATGLPTVAAFGVGDPVATGLVESLAKPGGNLTGISDNAAELSAKRLALLKETAPNLRRVAMLWNRDDLGMTLRYRASAKAAEAAGIAVESLGVAEPDDFNEAFAAMERAMPDAILMVADALTIFNRKRVFDFAAARHLPAIYEFASLVRDGGLMSYGADIGESFQRAADLVNRILKGAKPADLPFEQPTRYVFALNLKTAQALSLAIPPSLLARADEVIE